MIWRRDGARKRFAEFGRPGSLAESIRAMVFSLPNLLTIVNPVLLVLKLIDSFRSSSTHTETAIVSDSDIVLTNDFQTFTVSGDSVRAEYNHWYLGSTVRTIPIEQITSVEVQRPTSATLWKRTSDGLKKTSDPFSGFIRFVFFSVEPKNDSSVLSGSEVYPDPLSRDLEPGQHQEDVFWFGTERYDAALKIKSYVDQWSTGG